MLNNSKSDKIFLKKIKKIMKIKIIRRISEKFIWYEFYFAKNLRFRQIDFHIIRLGLNEIV